LSPLLGFDVAIDSVGVEPDQEPFDVAARYEVDRWQVHVVDQHEIIEPEPVTLGIDPACPIVVLHESHFELALIVDLASHDAVLVAGLVLDHSPQGSGYHFGLAVDISGPLRDRLRFPRQPVTVSWGGRLGWGRRLGIDPAFESSPFLAEPPLGGHQLEVDQVGGGVHRLIFEITSYPLGWVAVPGSGEMDLLAHDASAHGARWNGSLLPSLVGG
jgi:hypothetical protein